MIPPLNFAASNSTVSTLLVVDKQCGNIHAFLKKRLKKILKRLKKDTQNKHKGQMGHGVPTSGVQNYLHFILKNVFFLNLYLKQLAYRGDDKNFKKIKSCQFTKSKTLLHRFFC